MVASVGSPAVRPANKSSAHRSRLPPAEEFGQRRRCQSVHRDRREEGEHREALAEVDVLRLVKEAGVLANGCPLVPLRVSVCEEQCELERLRQPDELQFGRS
jgi:hypothetical protein